MGNVSKALCSETSINKLAKTGDSGDPITTSSVFSYNYAPKKKYAKVRTRLNKARIITIPGTSFSFYLYWCFAHKSEEYTKLLCRNLLLHNKLSTVTDLYSTIKYWLDWSVISGFRREVAEYCARMGYHAVCSGNCFIDLCLKGLDLLNELRLKVHLYQLNDGL